MRGILLCSLFISSILITISYKNLKEKNKEKFYKKCLHPTVMVCNAERTSGGTGFIVRSEKKGLVWQNVILGAAHTILDNDNLLVKVPKYRETSVFKGYGEFDLSVFAANEESDMFVGVFTSHEKMPTVDLNLKTELEMRAKIFHVGYGLFDDVRFDSGEVTQPSTFDPAPFRGMIRTNAFTFSGDSGGPLFLEDDLSVIGICHGIRRKNDMVLPNISYYKSIKEFLFWDSKVKNSLKWVYKTNEPIPVFPFFKLSMKRYEFIPPR